MTQTGIRACTSMYTEVCVGHTCHISKDMLHIWRRTSIHVYEEVRVFYRYSMYITDLVIFTIILNQAYGTLFHL